MSIIDPRRMRFRSAAASSWSAQPGWRPRRRGPCACGPPRRPTRSSRAISRSASSATGTSSCRCRSARVRTRRRRSGRRCSRRPASPARTSTPATNAPLIRSGSDLILFDTGSGAGFQPTAGKLSESLTAAGIDPAIDHQGGVHATPIRTTSGARSPMTARSAIPTPPTMSARRSGISGMDPDIMTKMPAEMQPFVTGAQKHLAGVKDRVTMLKPGDEIVTGISALDTRRPYAGPSVLRGGGGEGLIIIADAIISAGGLLPASGVEVRLRRRSRLRDRGAQESCSTVRQPTR